MLTFKEAIEYVGIVVDGLGVTVIALGIIFASYRYLSIWVKDSTAISNIDRTWDEEYCSAWSFW